MKPLDRYSAVGKIQAGEKLATGQLDRIAPEEVGQHPVGQFADEDRAVGAAQIYGALETDAAGAGPKFTPRDNEPFVSPTQREFNIPAGDLDALASGEGQQTAARRNSRAQHGEFAVRSGDELDVQSQIRAELDAAVGIADLWHQRCHRKPFDRQV
jgi:hypothetical protein